MTEQIPSSQASTDLAEPGNVPRLADALPAAEHHCQRALAHLDGRPGRGDLREALVALLEAAGGPDVGNAVRTHLERTGFDVPARCATDRGRERVLLAAVRLHTAAERDMQARLRSAGVAGHSGRQDPEHSARRATRAQYAERVLQARASAVDRVVVALAEGPLSTGGAGLWVDALVGDLPELSHGETDRDATAR